MLKFIDENDFLLVDTYKENEDGSVSWVYDEGEGLPTHSGVIRPGFTRKDAEDNEIDVWQTMLNKAHSGEIFIQWLTQEDKDAIATEQQIQAFKSNRQKLLDSAVVTTSNGNKYDADEQSISRMANAILAAQRKNLTNIQWSLADTPTELAVENMASIWSI